MRFNKMVLMNISLALVLVLGLSGCTIILQKGRRTDIEKILFSWLPVVTPRILSLIGESCLITHFFCLPGGTFSEKISPFDDLMADSQRSPFRKT